MITVRVEVKTADGTYVWAERFDSLPSAFRYIRAMKKEYKGNMVDACIV